MSTRSFPLTPTSRQVADEVLDDLRRRLTTTKWPLDAGNDDGYYGVRRSYLQELVAYWADGFDWRAAERAINAYEHYRVEVGGVPVHFMRKPGVGADPVPLILSHGWPWTFWHWANQGHRPARRPGRVRSRPGGCVRGDRAVVARLRVLDTAHVRRPPGGARARAQHPRLRTGRLPGRDAGLDAGTLGELVGQRRDVERVFTKDDQLTHATIYWAGDAIETSIRTHANNNRYPWTPSPGRRSRRPRASPSSAMRTRPA